MARPLSRYLAVSVLPPLVLVFGAFLATAQDKDAYTKARLKMVEEQIEREGIKNPAVLKAMREVPRHLFVAPKLRPNAYFEQILPIGYKQTLSPPYIVAYETETIDPQPSDRVLEIGTGSGYQAAVLSKIVKEVYTIEIVEPLGKEADARLKQLNYTNVHTKIGDGYQGWPKYAPFDKILVTCSPEDVPQPLVKQLREGGKMIIPLGERYNQAFYLFEKENGKLVRKKLLPTLFVPMTGIAEANRKAHADSAHPRLVNGGFEQSTDGIADGWYYQRQAKLEHTGAKEGKSYMTFRNTEPGRDAQALQAVGIDGKKVKWIKLSLWVKMDDVVPGGETYERPALVLHFFDSENRQVGKECVMGPWVGSSPWKRLRADFAVPAQTQCAVLRIGLNGATGSMSVDDIRLNSQLR